MIHRRISPLVIASLVALGSWLPSSAYGQLQAPNRRDVVERVADRCPGLIQRDHEFTDAVATVLNAEDARWGRNGKRGNAGDPSHDAIAFRNPASPFGVSVVDIIGAAGSPSASPAWIDQTQATIDARTTGVWVAPSGRLPDCLTGAVPPPGPGPGPVDPPPTGVDLGSVHEQLAAIRNELTSLRESRITKTDMEGQTGILYRLIAEQLIAVHIGELVERIDKLQADVAAVKTRVERARILGY
jgi:hypothetical protein